MTARRTNPVRLLPVAIVVAAGLLVLKLLGLALNGGYLLTADPVRPVAEPRFGRALTDVRRNPVWAEDITGSIQDKKEAPAKDVPKDAAKDVPKDTAKDVPKDAAKDAAKPKDASQKAEAGKADAGKPDAAKPAAAATGAGRDQADGKPPITAAERDILEKLGNRRQQIEERLKDVEMRETLLKSAEKAIDDKLGALKESEGRIEEATRSREGGAQATLKPLVVMYEAMKPREAARVFEKMESRQLVTLVRAMNPRKLSEILGQMSPDAAEKLTSALLRQVSQDTPAPARGGSLSDAGTSSGQPPAAKPQGGVEELPRLPILKTPKS